MLTESACTTCNGCGNNMACAVQSLCMHAAATAVAVTPPVAKKTLLSPLPLQGLLIWRCALTQRCNFRSPAPRLLLLLNAGWLPHYSRPTMQRHAALPSTRSCR